MDGIAILKMPGIDAISGDGPSRYADAINQCPIRAGSTQAWVIDLRGNGGGNMYPMIAGLAPLLPPGPLYSFLDGHGRPTVQVRIGTAGVEPAAPGLAFSTPDVGVRQVAPVIVLLGPGCASSCEQTANALAARPRTLFVGSRTAGYMTANVAHVLDSHYTLLLTEGYTADPCGRPINDTIEPDIAVDTINRLSVTDVLKVESVARWLEQVRHKTNTPISHDERVARCARS